MRRLGLRRYFGLRRYPARVERDADAYPTDYGTRSIVSCRFAPATGGTAIPAQGRSCAIDQGLRQRLQDPAARTPNWSDLAPTQRGSNAPMPSPPRVSSRRITLLHVVYALTGVFDTANQIIAPGRPIASFKCSARIDCAAIQQTRDVRWAALKTGRQTLRWLKRLYWRERPARWADRFFKELDRSDMRLVLWDGLR